MRLPTFMNYFLSRTGVYIARAIRFRDIRGGSEGLGEKKGKREKDGFSGIPWGQPYRRIPVSRTGGTGRLCRGKQHGDSTGVGHSGMAAAFPTAFSAYG